MFRVKFKEKVVEIEKEISILEFLKENDGHELLKRACCAKVDDEVCDLRDSLKSDCVLKILTFEDEEGKRAFWHTTAHVLAEAILSLFKDAQFGTGPAIENGFYYDVVTNPKICVADFEKIEKKMKEIVKNNTKIERKFISYDEAKNLFEKAGQKYKLELIEKFKGQNQPISIYQQGEFFDLCKGPHLLSTGMIKAVKLLNVTGAYWQKDAKNDMLDRVYGISFLDKKDLKNHIMMMEERKKVDHRKLGKELELFSFVEEGPGFCFFLPNGVAIKNALIEYWRKEHKKAGYQEIMTPTILSKKLWQTSGHWDHYKNNMYTTVIDDEDFAIKPMNCPGSILVYKMKNHSYKDLPLRLCEFGTVHRHELSGTLHGLMRARCFTQDDAHIFLTKDQIKEEVRKILELIGRIYDKFGFSYSLKLATMPDDHIGDVKTWDDATKSLQDAIISMGIEYQINEKDGAFYGPKIDCYLKDCLGRSWQCGTVQLDFQLPQRFNLEFVNRDSMKETPIMIHRVVYGSIERFIGILTEHFKGAFPFFIAPVQFVVLPVSDKFNKYAEYVVNSLQQKGFRASKDDRDEKLGYKMRQAQMKKTPYIIVVGEQEETNNSVSIRKHGETKTVQEKLSDFMAKLKEKV